MKESTKKERSTERETEISNGSTYEREFWGEYSLRKSEAAVGRWERVSRRLEKEQNAWTGSNEIP